MKAFTLILLCTLLTACGQKGGLYLEDQPTAEVTPLAEDNTTTETQD